ncbi:MAG: hypothetical protein LBD69_00660 [Puniceicoccales bacterium]|jgi:hypothetical protein|nr:hypothetical protein [Puniceicoccales bacterium]
MDFGEVFGLFGAMPGQVNPEVKLEILGRSIQQPEHVHLVAKPTRVLNN